MKDSNNLIQFGDEPTPVPFTGPATAASDTSNIITLSPHEIQVEQLTQRLQVLLRMQMNIQQLLQSDSHTSMSDTDLDMVHQMIIAMETALFVNDND